MPIDFRQLVDRPPDFTIGGADERFVAVDDPGSVGPGCDAVPTPDP